MGFSANVSGDAENGKVDLVGFLNESASLPAIKASKSLVINFDGVTFMNSSGILVWLRWMKLLVGIPQLVLEKCPPSIVTTISTVRDFLPENGRVASFYVPYANDEGDETKKLILLPSGAYKIDELVVLKTTEADGKVYEIDVNPKSYLAFFRK